MPPVDVSVTTTDRHTVVTVVGELDVDSHQSFADVAVAAARDADRLVLDLTEVGFIDSTGIGALTQVRQELGGQGPVQVVPSGRVRSALTITGLVEVFDVCDSLTTALDGSDGTDSDGSGPDGVGR